MNKLELIQAILGTEEKQVQLKGTFLEVGKSYLFRTVTMIYTGRIKEMRGDEILLEDAAWIPDTKRWNNTLQEEDFNEIEPYIRPVILWRGGMLDCTEIKKLPLSQK